MIGDAQIVCGEMHYPRIPRECWRARLELAYAMGLDAVSTYVFWNLHEPQPEAFDFSDRNDVAAFVREAAACGLTVVLRPGPYVCAEWDFGGLPSWLLAQRAVALRTIHPSYMAPVRRWLLRLGRELAPLQRAYGGPIVAIQLENEYGAFGEDAAYLQALRGALDEAGFGASPYYTIDQPGDLARGSLAGVPIATTFGVGDGERTIAAARALRPAQRPTVGEYWAGWFDHWGDVHARRDDAEQVREFAWLLEQGCSVNVYMLHGGTNFGFTNGANLSEDRPFEPVTTSYDYLAAIDESGRPSPKYFAFRDVIARHRERPPRPVPAASAAIAIPDFTLSDSASLDLGENAVRLDRPVPMEDLGQGFGFVCYATDLARGGSGMLECDAVHDYATVIVDGRIRGYLDRRRAENVLRLEGVRDGARLQILVENCGRVNYGFFLSGERKGITRSVRWNGSELSGWHVAGLPLDDLSRLRFTRERTHAPAYYRGTVRVDRPGDTFFDTSDLGKGVLWLNGHNLGRYWSIGPQASLYCPAAWLRQGSNEVVVFDVTPLSDPRMRGTIGPVYRDPMK
ncbi:MAG: beta-galactosidase [Candidatus Eremiobacteraeota bacterium]|nr:beta-galactosidase [Candidatus Eremiobacteraeota bacterium]